MAVNLYQKNKYFLSTDFSSPWWTEGPRYISARRQSWSDSHINRVTGALSRIKVELSGRNWYTILLLYVLCLTFFTAMSSPIIILSMDPHSPPGRSVPTRPVTSRYKSPLGATFPANPPLEGGRSRMSQSLKMPNEERSSKSEPLTQKDSCRWWAHCWLDSQDSVSELKITAKHQTKIPSVAASRSS